MKVDAVSLSQYGSKDYNQILSHNNDNSLNYDYAYMYQKENKSINLLNWHRKEFIAGLLAFAAAIYSLSMFAGRNTTPKSIIELSDNFGLNSISGNETVVRMLKDQILYPVMSVKQGYTSLLKKDVFKTGVIIAGEQAKKVTDALLSHAKHLGIDCVQYREHGGNIPKEVNKALDKALSIHAEDKKRCVIVNIGDIGAFSRMESSKTNAESHIEKRLIDMPKGVIWVGWTDKTKKIPYFYNNTPTLYAKLEH